MDDTSILREKRIKDADSARTLFLQLRKNSIGRREVWAKVQSQLDGASPFKNDDLVKLGQGWRCNTNFRDAASTLEQVLISYYRLVHDTTNLAAVTFHEDGPNVKKWEELFQENYNRFVEDWGADYVMQYLLMSQNHVGFGAGLGHWATSESPRWISIKAGDIEVPERSASSVEKLEFVYVRQEMTLAELYDRVRDEETASKSTAVGWCVDAVNELLVRCLKDGTTRAINYTDVIEVQEMLRNNSLFLSSQHAPLRVVHLFVKEFDGKISKYIFPEQQGVTKFLYDDSESSNRPDKMTKVLFAIFFEAGNGLFYGTKGFGIKNFPLAQIANRLKSRAVDRTLLDGLNFKDLSDGQRTVIPITNIGPYNFLPKDVEQIQAYPTGRSVLETIEMVDGQFNTNAARYRDQGRQVANTNTATQANILAGIQSNVDIANATLYLKQFAKSILTEQFARLRAEGSSDPDAKLFKERCVKEGGMDEKAFHKAEITVRTGADPGAMSLVLQGEKAIQGMGLPSANKRYFEEKWVATNFGAQAVDKALLPIDATSDIRSQRQALMENTDMGEGNSLPVDPQDNHAAHLPVHLHPLQIMVDQYKQSGRINPDSLVALQNAIPHVEKHFEYMKTDKLQEGLYRQLYPIFTEVQSFAEGIFRQIEKMHTAAQPPQGAGFSPSDAVGALQGQQEAEPAQ